MTGVDTLCPDCSTRLFLKPGGLPPACPGCSRVLPMRLPAPAGSSILTGCTVCGGSAFYLQKDFSQRTGCLIFLVGAVLAPWTHYLSLLAGLVLDLILYVVLPLVSICYTCRSVYRGYARNPEHGAYDPNVAWTHQAREGPWAPAAAAPGRAVPQRPAPGPASSPAETPGTPDKPGPSTNSEILDPRD